MDKDFLHRQLIKLGDMMGDGLHKEPDGKWISREYAKIAKKLGYAPPRRNNSEKINAAMAERVKQVSCQKCGGELKQTRKGSMRAKCQTCGGIYILLKSKRVSK